MEAQMGEQEILGLLPARRGHFLLESGHHGNLWLELELLCYRPEPIRRPADRLAEALARHRVDAVCGPLVDGAFVALMVASTLSPPATSSPPRPERPVGGPAP